MFKFQIHKKKDTFVPLGLLFRYFVNDNIHKTVYLSKKMKEFKCLSYPFEYFLGYWNDELVMFFVLGQ